MKVLCLITKSEIGGAQTYVWQLASHFNASGNEAAVMAYPGGWLEQRASQNNADYGLRAAGQGKREAAAAGGLSAVGAKIKFYPNKYFLNAPHPIKDFLAFLEIVKAIKDFNPDIVHVNSAKAALLGRIAAFFCGKKIVYTVHGWAFTEGAPLWRRIVGVVSEKIIGLIPQKIICVSQYDYNLALRYKIVNPKKLALIYNGIEIAGDLPEKKWQHPLKIVFAGRLASPKRPDILMEAFCEMDNSLKEKAELIIVGDGPNRKNLEELAKRIGEGAKIKIAGQLKREQVLEILKESHIFVLITDYEAFPYTTIEAMSRGLAIIISDVGGAPEAIDENCGILVKKGDKGALKTALERLIADIDLAKKMGQAARKKAEKEFSLKKVIERVEGIYAGIDIL